MPLCTWIKANDDSLSDVIVVRKQFFMSLIPPNDLSHVTYVGDMEDPDDGTNAMIQVLARLLKGGLVS